MPSLSKPRCVHGSAGHGPGLHAKVKPLLQVLPVLSSPFEFRVFRVSALTHGRV